MIRSMTKSEAEAIARWLAIHSPTQCPQSLAPVCVPIPRDNGKAMRRREIDNAIAHCLHQLATGPAVAISD